MRSNEKKVLAVFPNDPIKAYYKKGEIKERYYNPCNFFDEVHIISPCNQDVDEGKVQIIAGDAKLEIHPIGRLSSVLPFYRYKAINIIKEIKPDVIRSYNPLMQGYYATYCSKKLKIPSVVSIHTDYEAEEKFNTRSVYKFIDFFVRKYIKDYAFNNANEVICVTKYLTSYAKKHGAKDVEVIYNRVDTKQFMKRGDNTSSDKITILCVGILNKNKNQECLIKAIRDLDVNLILIGDGELYYELKQITKEMKIENKVKFIKSIPHSKIHECYSSADIFAIATHYEGFCIPVLEAMASSLPVTASKIGPIQELVADSGILVENVPEAFRNAFGRLISNPELREELGEKGRKRALEISGEIMEKREMALYKDLILKYPSKSKRNIISFEP